MSTYSNLLTPAENLALEVVAARFRLGHQGWNFDSRHSEALYGLQEKGYIIVQPTDDPRVITAYLTQAGVDAYITPDYIPPIVKQIHDEYASQYGL